MDDLKLGDLIIKDDGKLGFTIAKKNGDQDTGYFWINKIGEIALMNWLIKKNAATEEK